MKCILSVLGCGVAIFVSGCVVDASDTADEPGEDEVGTAELAVTVGQRNTVCAFNGIWLRTGNHTSAPTIAQMPMWSTMQVHSVDWSTGMAYGYSYNLGRWGYANKTYLTMSCGEVGGGTT